jgi:hypothetical protein
MRDDQEDPKGKYKHNPFAKDLIAYPRTPHLPHKPNMSVGDFAASSDDAASLFTSQYVYVEEKLDGGNCGMMLADGEILIRNRDHVLKKGFLKDTPAKLQFRSAWNWAHEHKSCFDRLNDHYGTHVAVYGEWCLALHGIVYDRLWQHFTVFDIVVDGRFIDSAERLAITTKCGFWNAQMLHIGPIPSWDFLEQLCNEKSEYSTTDLREGIYIKESDGKYITKRFKMIRDGYVQGSKWSHDQITKQTLR